MTWAKRIALVLATAAVVLSVGTGAYSSFTAQRGVSVAVEENEDAFLSIEAESLELDNGEYEAASKNESEHDDDEEDAAESSTKRSVTLLELENNFREPLDTIEIELASGDTAGPPVFHGGVRSPTNLDVGEDYTVMGNIACATNADNEETWTFRITASGESVAVNTKIDIAIECTGAPSA
jgi:hypothetical protein